MQGAPGRVAGAAAIDDEIGIVRGDATGTRAMGEHLQLWTQSDGSAVALTEAADRLDNGPILSGAGQ